MCYSSTALVTGDLKNIHFVLLLSPKLWKATPVDSLCHYFGYSGFIHWREFFGGLLPARFLLDLSFLQSRISELLVLWLGYWTIKSYDDIIYEKRLVGHVFNNIIIMRFLGEPILTSE